LLEQLGDPGIMVIPVGDEYSQSLVKIKKTNGEIMREDKGWVRFVKLLGDHGWKE
jgi:protein-L-isoaspartate(D-aspartate) O-methyltransferase